MRFSKQKIVFLAVLVCVLAYGALLVGCSQGNTASKSSTSGSATAAAVSSDVVTAVDSSDPDARYASGTHHAVLTVEGYDPVTIELNADVAPVTVWNFCKLANEGYYDGLTFYRFVEGFCMQGGTKGNSASGQDNSLKRIVGEFSENDVNNPLADHFTRGVVAMARTSDPNSAGSTFFVTLDSSVAVESSLNGLYAAFGTIDEAGMEIVDVIVDDYLPNVTDRSSGAIANEANQAKITSLKIVD